MVEQFYKKGDRVEKSTLYLIMTLEKFIKIMEQREERLIKNREKIINENPKKTNVDIWGPTNLSRHNGAIEEIQFLIEMAYLIKGE